jgi:hypothetical protein
MRPATCASYLIEAGLNDLELTATIGHSDSRTTKRIYGHLFPDSGATIAANRTPAGRLPVVTDETTGNAKTPRWAGPS